MSRDPIQIHGALSKEASLLLACISRSMHLTPHSPSIPVEINWPNFLGLIHRHHLSGTALDGLLTLDPPGVPDSILTDLKTHQGQNIRRSFLLTSRLIDVLRLFRLHNIPAMSFKGPVLSLDAYGNPAVRSTGDLDLLLRRRDMAAARKLLLDRGFAPIFPTSTPAEAKYLLSLTDSRLAHYVNSHSEHHLMHPDGRINIDLHWDITLRQFATPLDSNRLWKNRRQVQLGQNSIPTFGLEDLLLVLCMNAAKDNWLRFDRICDVAGLILRNPCINFRSLMNAARKPGAHRMVLVTLLLAHELLNLSLPEIIEKQIAADPACISLATNSAGKMFASNSAAAEQSSRLNEILIQLRARDQMHGRMRYLLCQCYPTVGDWTAFPLPAPFEFLHFLLRPFRLMLQ